MSSIVHIISGNTKVGAISSVKRILVNYAYDDTEILIVSYGKEISVDGYNVPDRIFFLNLKCTDNYERWMRSKFNLYYLFVTILSFFTDITKLYTFCKKKHISVIHTHHFIDSIHFCFLRITGIKVITHVRAIVNKRLMYGVPYYIYRYLIYRFSDKVIGISKASLEVLNKKSDKNIIIYNGIDGKSAHDNPVLEQVAHQGNFIVGTVIRFTKGKGIFFLADCIVEYFKQFPDSNIKFLLIAPVQDKYDESCKESFFEILSKAGLTDRLIYFNHFPDYSYYMPYIDLLFHTTIEREGFGNTVLEASWFAKPVISTPCFGPLDIVEDGKSGYILSSVDAKEAVALINKVSSDKELYDKLSEKAYQISHSQKFSIKKNMELLHNVYSGLLC